MVSINADTLQKAIDYLGAVEVAQPGGKTAGGSIAKTTIYAAKSPTSGTYLCTDALGLVAMVDATAKPTDYAEMPTWWSPEHRTACVVLHCCTEVPLPTRFRTSLEARKEYGPQFKIARITADLETGEEIPA